ncbi:hypothetical protein ACFY4I_22235 [Streptomyces scabiei]|uniref:hypothetical protein n=1 Tax=Streptomyces scabiei TaxID=1930 RepID=UPI0036CD79C9
MTSSPLPGVYGYPRVVCVVPRAITVVPAAGSVQRSVAANVARASSASAGIRMVTVRPFWMMVEQLVTEMRQLYVPALGAVNTQRSAGAVEFSPGGTMFAAQ